MWAICLIRKNLFLCFIISANELEELKIRSLTRLAKLLNNKTVMLYFPYMIDDNHTCNAAFKMLAQYDQVMMAIYDQMEVQLTAETIPEVSYVLIFYWLHFESPQFSQMVVFHTSHLYCFHYGYLRFSSQSFQNFRTHSLLFAYGGGGDNFKIKQYKGCHNKPFRSCMEINFIPQRIIYSENFTQGFSIVSKCMAIPRA